MEDRVVKVAHLAVDNPSHGEGVNVAVVGVENGEIKGVQIVVTGELALQPLAGFIVAGKNLTVKVKIVAFDDVLGGKVKFHGERIDKARKLKTCRSVFEK